MEEAGSGIDERSLLSYCYCIDERMLQSREGVDEVVFGVEKKSLSLCQGFIKEAGV